MDCALEIARRRKGERGFTVLPRRRAVERTPAWLGKHRRMSKDCERLAETSEAWIRLGMICLALRVCLISPKRVVCEACEP